MKMLIMKTINNNFFLNDNLMPTRSDLENFVCGLYVYIKFYLNKANIRSKPQYTNINNIFYNDP